MIRFLSQVKAKRPSTGITQSVRYVWNFEPDAERRGETAKPLWLQSRDRGRPAGSSGPPPKWIAGPARIPKGDPTANLKRADSVSKLPSARMVKVLKVVRALTGGLVARDAPLVSASRGPSSDDFFRFTQADAPVVVEEGTIAQALPMNGRIYIAQPSLHVCAQAGDITVRVNELGVRVTSTFPVTVLGRGKAIVIGDVGTVPPGLWAHQDDDAHDSGDLAENASDSEVGAEATEAPSAGQRSATGNEAIQKDSPRSEGTGISLQSDETSMITTSGDGVLDVTLPYFGPLENVRIAGGVGVTLVDAPGDVSSGVNSTAPRRLLSRDSLTVEVLACSELSLPPALQVRRVGLLVDGKGELRGERMRVRRLGVRASAYAAVDLTGTHAEQVAVDARDRSRVAGVHILSSASLALDGACQVEVTAKQGADVESNVINQES